MKNAIFASTLLVCLSSATPQWSGSGGNGGLNGWDSNAGSFAAFPSCASSCKDSTTASPSSLCGDQVALKNVSSCVDSSSCSDSDKSSAEQAIAQLCANTGTTITQVPYATFHVTSGGSAWPTQWSTDSAWASAASGWGGSGSPGGWHGGPYGPFGAGGPGNGWGPGSWSSGAWTSGPWTSWWGTSGCPASTWSGWTNGPWSTDAPWTTWTGCTASTTASHVYTSTYTTDGQQTTSLATSFGIKVAEATGSASSDSSSSSNSNGAASSTSSGSGAMPTNFAFAGSAAGILGVVAGALLL